MLSEDVIKFQLEHIYRSIDLTREGRHTIKKWAITAWLAVLVAIFSGKLSAELAHQLPILVICVGIFWFYEGVSAVHTLLYEHRARLLEELLLDRENNDYEPKSLLVISGNKYVPLEEKLSLFFAGCFRLETVYLFYFALIVVGIVSILLSKTT
ncbi:MAG: hypothetical protein MI685_00730 [Chlorobiales bacterium]|nr:hypothetical protein [Chlorobiales bacterium]